MSGERSATDELWRPTVDRRLRTLPTLLTTTVRMVRRAAGRTFAIAVALQLLGSVAVLVQVLVLRSVLGELVAHGSRTRLGGLLPQLVVLVICLAVTAAVAVARTALQQLLADLVGRAAVLRVLERAGTVDLLDYETSQLHDRLQRALFNGTYRPLQLTTGLLVVLAGAGGSLGVGVALLAISPLFLVLAFAAAVPVWLFGVAASRAMYRFAHAQTPRDRERMYLQELLSRRDTAKELRAYAVGGHLLARWQAGYDRRITELRAVVAARVRSGLAAAALSALVVGSAVALLVALVHAGHLSLGAAGAALGGLLLLGGQLQQIGNGLAGVYESALFVQDWAEFVGPRPGPHAPGGPTAVAPPLQAVAARGLGFCYPDADVPALADVDLDIAAGQVVALVGENGSGKSTLTKLVAGLYPAQTGRLAWNGTDYAVLDPTSIREQVAVLFQDFARYEFSAADNVGFGRWDGGPHDPARLDAAATRSGAADVLAGLPDGWATRLGPQFDGGRELSGGQWQRLAIARALYRDAPLVVLDEPTAALDPRAEVELFERVRDLFAGRAVLLVSHRFASVRHADRIHVLHEGRVVESGTHEELLAHRGRYAELFALQSAALLGEPG